MGNLSTKGCHVSRFGGDNSKIKNALFNDKDSRYTLHREKPVHRRMAEMSASGYTAKEIAAATGYSRCFVSDILHQPFMREKIVADIAKSANDEIKELLEKAGPNAVRRIINIAETSKNEKNVLAASNEILDRFLGKPTQTVVTEEKKPVTQLTDDELDRAIAEARGKETAE